MTLAPLLLLLVSQEVSAEAEVEVPSAPSPIQWELTLDTTGRAQLDDGNVTPDSESDWDPVAEDFWDWTATIGGSVRYKGFVATLQLDGAFYFNESVAAGDANQFVRQSADNRYEDTIRLEYISGVYSSGKNNVTLGDFYVTLGRGMILAIRKVADVGIDNKLRGASFRFNPIGNLTVQAFGGLLNIKNYEAGTGYRYDEPNDFVMGGRAEYGFGKYAKIGAHVMRYQPFDLPGDLENDNFGWGATVELPRPVPWASFYAEVAQMFRTTSEDGIEDDSRGLGVYGSGNFYAGPVTILLEGKYYDELFQLLPGGELTSLDGRQLINRLQEPPTAERPQAIILTNRSVGGGRARVDYRINEHVTPFVGFGRYRDFESTIEADITAVYGGGLLNWTGGHGTVNAGWRAELQDVDNLANTLLTRDWHWIADFSQKIFGDYTIELFGQGRHASEQAGAVGCLMTDPLDPGQVCDNGVLKNADGQIISNLTTWVEGRVALSFASKGGWSVTGAWEFYTKSPQNFRPHYFSIMGQWEFIEGSTIRALVGQERAGLKCSGGACRFFPGFEGARVELNVRI